MLRLFTKCYHWDLLYTPNKGFFFNNYIPKKSRKNTATRSNFFYNITEVFFFRRRIINHQINWAQALIQGKSPKLCVSHNIRSGKVTSISTKYSATVTTIEPKLSHSNNVLIRVKSVEHANETVLLKILQITRWCHKIVRGILDFTNVKYVPQSLRLNDRIFITPDTP